MPFFTTSGRYIYWTGSEDNYRTGSEDNYRMLKLSYLQHPVDINRKS